MSFFKNCSEWPLVPLKDIATLKRGYDLPVTQRNEGDVPIYAANGQNGSHNEAKIKGPGVITGRSGTIGKVHYCSGDFWPLNTSLYVMNFHGNDPKWVYYLLSEFHLERFSEGAGVPTLNRNLVHDELVPLPPLTEQKRIAAILDKADAIRRKRQQAIQLAETFLRSLFLSYGLSPIKTKLPKRDSSDPGWKWEKLIDVARLESGHTPSRNRDDYWGGDVKWLSLKDIKQINNMYIRDTVDKPTELGIRNSSARVLPKGTVALCRTASVGKCVIIGEDMATSQDFVDWVCGKDILPEFLYTVIQCSKPEFDKLKQGSTHKTIYMPTLKEFCVLLPPMNIQKKISDAMIWVAGHIRSLEENENYCSDLFYSLSQKAFSGQL